MMINSFNLVGEGIDLGDADRQVRVELVSQSDAVGLDEVEEILCINVGTRWGTLNNLHLSQLVIGYSKCLEGVPAILQDDFQEGITGALLEFLYLHCRRKKWSLDYLADFKLHGYMPL